MTDYNMHWLGSFFTELIDIGQQDMKQKILNFGRFVVDGDINGVEASFPEVLAYARSTENTWLEVCLRHWYLLSKIDSSEDPRLLVTEALDLVALAHSDNAEGCPQRICAIEDLTVIYTSIDAAGYADERLQALEEVLMAVSNKIDCYKCLVYGKVAALLDLDRADEAVTVFETAAMNAPAVISSIRSKHYYESSALKIVRAYIETNRSKDALALLEKCKPDRSETQGELDLLTAWAYLQKGDVKAAHNAFHRAWSAKDPADIHLERLVQVMPRVIEARIIEANDGLLQRLLALAESASTRGRSGAAFDCAHMVVSLSRALNRNDVAVRAIAIMEACVPSLNRLDSAKRTLIDARQIAL